MAFLITIFDIYTFNGVGRRFQGLNTCSEPLGAFCHWGATLFILSIVLFCFTMIGRADFEGPTRDVTMGTCSSHLCSCSNYSKLSSWWMKTNENDHSEVKGHTPQPWGLIPTFINILSAYNLFIPVCSLSYLIVTWFLAW